MRNKSTDLSRNKVSFFVRNKTNETSNVSSLSSKTIQRDGPNLKKKKVKFATLNSRGSLMKEQIKKALNPNYE